MDNSKLLEHTKSLNMSPEEFEKEVAHLYATMMVLALEKSKEGERVQIRKVFDYDTFTLHITAYRIFKEDQDIEHPIDKLYKDREDK